MRNLSHWGVSLVLTAVMALPAARAEESKGGEDAVVFDTVGEAHGVDFKLGLARWDESKGRRELTFEEFAESAFDSMVAGPLYGEDRQPPEEYALKPLTELLVDTKVRRATVFAHNCQQAGAFGGLRQGGVYVLELAEPLGDVAGALLEKLRQMGGEERSIAGHAVIVCEWHFVKEPYIPKAPWEDLAVVIPDAKSKTLIYSTSPAALEGYFASQPAKLLAEVKKKHKLLARPEVSAWVACLNEKQQEVDAQEPPVQFLMAWSEDEKLPTFDMQFFPAAKNYQELTRRHPLLDTILGPFPLEEGESPLADHELKSVEGGSHLELKLPVLDETRSPSDLTKEEERLETCKMAISIFVGNLLLDRNRSR